MASSRRVKFNLNALSSVRGVSVCLLTLGVLCTSTVDGYFISIDAHGEECYYDRVKAGTKMGLTFEVIDGGFLDIEAKITGKLYCLNFMNIIKNFI